MVKHEVHVALVGPTGNVEAGVQDSIHKNHPSTVDVKLVEILVGKQGDWGVLNELHGSSELGNEDENQA